MSSHSADEPTVLDAIAPGHAKMIQDRLARIEQLRHQLEPLLVNHNRCVLEIGCGHGHFLTDYAAAHPQEVCIGFDLISKRIEKANAKRSKQGLNNLLFIKAELSECFAALPGHCQFSSVFMLYPDPWPKKRHFRRRMIQADFLRQLHQRMATNGHFYFRTDDADLFDWTVEHLSESEYWSFQIAATWPFERQTLFELITGQRRDLIATPV